MNVRDHHILPHKYLLRFSRLLKDMVLDQRASFLVTTRNLYRTTFIKNIIFSLLIAAALGSCARMSLVDAYKLNKVRISTTNVDRLCVAVLVPKYFRLRQPGAVMTMSLVKTRSKPAQSERFVLQEIPAPQALKQLSVKEGANGNFHAFRVRADDIPRFELIRRQSRENAPGGKRSGSMSVTASVCRTITQRPVTVPLSVYLKAEETGDYVAIIRDGDLLAEAGTKNADEIIPPCTDNK